MYISHPTPVRINSVIFYVDIEKCVTGISKNAKITIRPFFVTFLLNIIYSYVVLLMKYIGYFTVMKGSTYIR